MRCERNVQFSDAALEVRANSFFDDLISESLSAPETTSPKID